jgi:hypothetical protein
MIDRPDQVGRLLEQLSAALPIPARVTPELQVLLREKNGITVPATCNVTWISYAGDEGGIVCQLDAGVDTSAVFASLTHLRFDPRLPLACDIHTYQKHRVKRLRRQPPAASRQPPAAVNLRRHQRPKSSRFSRGAVATLTIIPRCPLSFPHAPAPCHTAQTVPTARDRHLQIIAERGRMAWQKVSGYHRRALVEADISCFKRLIGDGLRSRTDWRRGRDRHLCGRTEPNARTQASGLRPHLVTVGQDGRDAAAWGPVQHSCAKLDIPRRWP